MEPISGKATQTNTRAHEIIRRRSVPLSGSPRFRWPSGQTGLATESFFFFENANVRPFRFLFFTKTKPTRTQSRRPNDPQPSPPRAAFEFRGCLAALALDGGVRGPAGVSERHSTSAVMMMVPSGRVSYLAEG